ncbi:YybH family protein [Maricaulis sp. CAU 1757]
MMHFSLAAAAALSMNVALDAEPAVEEVLEGYSQALSDEDVAAAEQWVLAEGTDFTIFEGSGSDVGWAEYRDHHLAPEFAAEHVEFHVYDWSEYSVTVDENLAVATFDIRMEYTMRGEARERNGHGTAVLQRTEQGWRIRHLHTS